MAIWKRTVDAVKGLKFWVSRREFLEVKRNADDAYCRAVRFLAESDALMAEIKNIAFDAGAYIDSHIKDLRLSDVSIAGEVGGHDSRLKELEHQSIEHSQVILNLAELASKPGVVNVWCKHKVDELSAAPKKRRARKVKA